MMAHLKRLFGIKPSTVTFKDVEPAPRDPDIERRIKEAQAELVQEHLKIGRTSWAIRQELAGNALSIVAGDRT